MPQMLRLREFLFFTPVILQAVVGLASVPVLVSTVGLNAYPAIAVGQAIGAIYWILLSLGYNSTGPARIAALGGHNASNLYRSSMALRLVALFPLTALVVVTCLALSSRDPTLTLSFAVATAIGGLISSWVFVGVADPIGSILFEAAPRLLPMIVGLVTTALTGNVWAFVVGQSLGVMSSVLVTSLYVRRLGDSTYGQELSKWKAELGHQGRMTMITTGHTALLSAPLLVLTMGSFSAQNSFVIVDKLQKQAAGTMTPLASILMSTASRPQPIAFSDRTAAIARTNAKWLSIIGVAIFLVGALLAEFAVAILSAAAVNLSSIESVLLAGWISSTVVGQAWQTCVLVPARRERRGLRILTATALLTVAALLAVPHAVPLAGVLLLLLVSQIFPIILTLPSPDRSRGRGVIGA